MQTKARTSFLLGAAAAVGLAAGAPSPAQGQVGKGLSGPHWNL